MRFLRNLLDRLEKPFRKGERLEKLHPLYEAQDTFLFTPGTVTGGTTHVRDAVDLKRIMVTVVIALVPCVLIAFYNTGYQANLAIAGRGASAHPGFQSDVFLGLGFAHDPGSVLGNLVHGGLFFLPVLAVTFLAGGLIEVAFAVVRKHEINEGFLVTGLLFPLTLPPTIPLWQVALGIAFGVLVGKELFGGTGMNILNPALTGRAFLFFSYPAQLSGDAPWIAADFASAAASSTLPDAVSGATWLGKAASSNMALEGRELFGPDWWDAFVGLVPGSMGETSALACLIGAAILIVTQVGSWRTMLGVVIGTFLTASLLHGAPSETNPMFAVPFHWHVVLGGWAFGAVFMATDPVSSAFTSTGKWLYGIGIGVMVILIRVVNPAYPEGMMLAILFMNVFAPLIDYFVVQANIKRRKRRDAIVRS